MLGISAASKIENILASKAKIPRGVIKVGEETIRAGEGTIRIFNVYLMLKKINGFLNEHK